MKTKNLIVWSIVVLVVVWLGYIMFSVPQIGVVGSVHSHANFMVFVDGEQINFASPQYMVKVREVHIENMNGVAIHKHSTGVTLGYFLKTLGFEFNEECFIKDNKEKFCNSEDKELSFYVNGNKNFAYGDYEILDGDYYLISYGSSEEEIKRQIGELSKIEIEG